MRNTVIDNISRHFNLFQFLNPFLRSISVLKDKQRSTKHTHKTKDRVTRTSPKIGGELRCSERVGSSCSTSGTSRVNLVAAPANGVYVSQLIRYPRACGSYHDFLDRGLLLTRKLRNQGFLLAKLKSSLRKFYAYS
jgi:hypothetical protein